MSENRQARGRPRDPGLDTKILSTAERLLSRHGYSALTVDAVAAEAGVGKAAIYRRFASKAELAFAASVHIVEIEPPADTGSLDGDLLALMTLASERMNKPVAKELAPALMADLRRDPELTARFQRTFWTAEIADFATILARAVSRGELTSAPNPALLHLMVLGPIFAAAYGFQAALTASDLQEFARTIAAGLTGHGTDQDVQ